MCMCGEMGTHNRGERLVQCMCHGKRECVYDRVLWGCWL